MAEKQDFIKDLLKTEAQYGELVKQARQQRSAALKSAQEAAELALSKERAQLENDFAAFKTSHVQDVNQSVGDLNIQVEKQIVDLNSTVAAQKGFAIDFLVKTVTTAN